MRLPTYSSRDVKVAWAGVSIDGLAPDSFVKFSRTGDVTNEEVGADGQLSVSILPDETGTCTISLQQQSAGNLTLSGVMLRQKQTRRLVVGTLEISDPSGSVLAILRGCHLKTYPEVDLGSDASGKTRDWVFFCEEMVFTSTPTGLDPLLEGSIDIASAIDSIIATASQSSI